MPIALIYHVLILHRVSFQARLFVPVQEFALACHYLENFLVQTLRILRHLYNWGAVIPSSRASSDMLCLS
jgi:hypothetical protein